MSTHKDHNLQGERRDQLLLTVDKEGNPVGTASRHICHTGEGRTHLAFLAFIADDKRMLTLTRRSKQKSLWPGYWDASTISHVLPGETPPTATQRRGREELGVNVEFTDLGAFYYFARHENGVENEYCHVLIGTSNQEIRPNPVEIDKIKKVSLPELLRETAMHKDAFTPWLLIALEKFGSRLKDHLS